MRECGWEEKTVTQRARRAVRKRRRRRATSRTDKPLSRSSRTCHDDFIHVILNITNDVNPKRDNILNVVEPVVLHAHANHIPIYGNEGGSRMAGAVGFGAVARVRESNMVQR